MPTFDEEIQDCGVKPLLVELVVIGTSLVLGVVLAVLGAAWMVHYLMGLFV